MARSIIIKAPAKVNLGLAVLGRRADGYHDLNSIMQQISLSDTLVLTPRLRQGWEFFCTEPSLAGESNLVCRAAALLSREAGCRLPGVRITLFKQIPVEAGLGGGSSDAAAALFALNRFWGLNFTLHKLLDLGAQLGSDVPFCLYGGTVQVMGRGEILEPLPPLPFHWVVVAVPAGLRLSTPAVYRSLVLGRQSVPPINDLAGAIKEGDCARIGLWFQRESVNTLEEAVLPACAPVAALKHRFKEMGLSPAMSGSGPSVFALVESYSVASMAVRSLLEEGTRAFLCWTVPGNFRKDGVENV
ncbi:MAG TPA: 4-(cytidine 5'-diphospho)-2-C-methyl-D-erythritol kinase [Bacillota bacterium]|nr:4-(cytidine 5'-diphospho)-2-C-methyl-D-erythritol kinase [Bacillota bacterium]